MSIFSRKSKPATHARAVEHDDSQGYKPTNAPNDHVTVDMIVQRMALQAASRRRMNNGHTPDYSVNSSSARRRTPPSGYAQSQRSRTQPSETRDMYSHGASRSMDAASSLAFQPSGGAAGLVQEPNRHRKSCATMTEQYTYVSTPLDRDMRDPRIDSRYRAQQAPQASRDSGYSSAAHSSPRHVPTGAESLGQEEARPSRSRKDVNGDYYRNGRPVSVSANEALSTKNKVVAAPSTRSTADGSHKRTSSYVSRLDPGSSNSFLSTSILDLEHLSEKANQGRTGPRSKDNSKACSTLGAPAVNNSDEPLKGHDLERLGSSGVYSADKAAFESSKTPMSHYQRWGLDQPANSPAAQMPRSQTLTGTPDFREPPSMRTQSLYTSSLSNLTPLAHRGDHTTPNAWSKSVLDPADNEISLLPQSEGAAPRKPIAASDGLGGQSNGYPHGENQSFSQPDSHQQTPQDAFPYLTGLANGAAQPLRSVLEGYRVNKRGQILDEEGDVIGSLVDGDIRQCARQKVNEKGEVVAESGHVIGHAQAVPQGTMSPMDYVQHNELTQLYQESLQSPILPATPTGTFTSMTSPRQDTIDYGSRSSPSKAFVFELDASTESQATPVMDHSDIFVPPFGDANSPRESSSTDSLKRGSPLSRRRQSNHSLATVLEGGARRKSYLTMVDDPSDPTYKSLLDTVPTAPASDSASVATGVSHNDFAVASQIGSVHHSNAESAVSRDSSLDQLRRPSQAGSHGTGPSHMPLARSPLSTATVTANTHSNPDAVLLNGAPNGRPSTPYRHSTTDQLIDDENEEPAPAPEVMRSLNEPTKLTKAPVRKRRSFFGFFFGKK